MSKALKSGIAPDANAVSGSTSPRVFISHDSRDAQLAEAFAKLLKGVSASMIKTFRSSDNKGSEGIPFGEEWYNRLMLELDSTSDVVCLFTERSLDRPWILFEAGVAKGKLHKPVIGIALGIQLSRVSTGPFYSFQNMDDSTDALTKLVDQLAERIPNLELVPDVVKQQLDAFKADESSILDSLKSSTITKIETREEAEETALAKLIEEMKSMPGRVAERLADMGDIPRRRKMRRFHPVMLQELMHMSGDPGNPIGILMAATLVREEAPWLYELAMEVYRAVKSGDIDAIERELSRIRYVANFIMHGAFMEEFGVSSNEAHMLIMEFPKMLDQLVRQNLDERKRPQMRKTPQNRLEQK